MKKILVIIVIITVGGIIWFAVGSNTSSTDSPQTDNSLSSVTQNATGKSGVNVGDQALDFTIKEIGGKEIKLSDLRGKYVLFAFMATWCVPCRIEADNARKAQEKNDFVVIQIDVDARENDQDLLKFKQELSRDDWLMAFDKSFIIAKPYNVKSFDTTLVVDPEGKIIYRDEGWPIDVKTLDDLFQGKFQQLVLGSIHEHSDVSAIISGKSIDFSQDKYQLKSPFVHFEDGDGKKLHKHANGITIKYFLGTLGWQYKEPCLVTDFAEYCDGKLNITINGQEENLTYEFKDGDVIEIVY